MFFENCPSECTRSGARVRNARKLPKVCRPAMRFDSFSGNGALKAPMRYKSGINMASGLVSLGTCTSLTSRIVGVQADDTLIGVG